MTHTTENVEGIDPTAYVAGVYVAVIQVKHDGPTPRYRRRVVMSLATAQRAVDRAHMDGKDAHIVLCKLVPMGGDRCG